MSKKLRKTLYLPEWITEIIDREGERLGDIPAESITQQQEHAYRLCQNALDELQGDKKFIRKYGQLYLRIDTLKCKCGNKGYFFNTGTLPKFPQVFCSECKQKVSAYHFIKRADSP